MTGVDLDAYCTRIGHDGPRVPTLETLRALHALHPAAIPFEAVDVLLGRGIELTPEALQAKLVTGRRGGYCYEQNGLFRLVLEAMGFAVEGLLARVLWMMPPDAPPLPRTHMALRVTIDGEPWLADVGFGSCVPTAPLSLAAAGPQPTPHDTFRLTPLRDGSLLELDLDGAWVPVYELSPERQAPHDYLPANWFVSTHPGSHFRRNLMVARTTPEARFTLNNNRFGIRTPDGRQERRSLTVEELARTLEETFTLRVEPDWRPVLEQAVAAGG